MMLLELRENAPAEKVRVKYVKVTNPDNPREFVYVEQSVYNQLAKEAAGPGMHGFFQNLWNGVKGAVGGFVASGGSITGAAAGAIGGFTGASSNVAVSPAASSGSSTISIPIPAAAPVPAVVQAPPVIGGSAVVGKPHPGYTDPSAVTPGSLPGTDTAGKKDNTLFWVIGIGGALFILPKLLKSR